MLHLPRTLIDPEMTGATSVTQTAFQKAHKTTMSFWDVIEHGDLSKPAVAELREVFPLSMVGHGQLNSAALIAGGQHDFHRLGTADSGLQQIILGRRSERLPSWTLAAE